MRHSATRCKDLEAWLVQMHSLLTSRDGHTIPPDVKAIETLISQHNVNCLLHFTLLGFMRQFFYIVGCFCVSFVKLFHRELSLLVAMFVVTLFKSLRNELHI